MLKASLDELEELKKELSDIKDCEMIDEQDNENAQFEKIFEIYSKICNKLLIIMFDPREIVNVENVLAGQNEAKIILADLITLKDNTKAEESKNKLLAIEQVIRLCTGEINDINLAALNKHEAKSINKSSNSFLLSYGSYIAAAALTAFVAYNSSLPSLR